MQVNQIKLAKMGATISFLLLNPEREIERERKKEREKEHINQFNLFIVNDRIFIEVIYAEDNVATFTNVISSLLEREKVVR